MGGTIMTQDRLILMGVEAILRAGGMMLGCRCCGEEWRPVIGGDWLCPGGCNQHLANGIWFYRQAFPDGSEAYVYYE